MQELGRLGLEALDEQWVLALGRRKCDLDDKRRLAVVVTTTGVVERRGLYRMQSVSLLCTITT